MTYAIDAMNDDKKNVWCHRLLLIASYFKLFPMNVTQRECSRKKSKPMITLYLFCFVSFLSSPFFSMLDNQHFCGAYEESETTPETVAQKSITVMLASAFFAPPVRVNSV